MVTPARAEGIRCNVRDVYKLARLFLDLNKTLATSRTIGLFASDFAYTLSSVIINELL